METNYFKGIALSLATAVAIFVFTIGISGYPWWMMLVMSIPAGYILLQMALVAIKGEYAFKRYTENKPKMLPWILWVYLILQGSLLILAHYAYGLMFLISSVTLSITIWLAVSCEGIRWIAVMVLSCLAQIITSSCCMSDPSSMHIAYEDGRNMLLEHEVISQEDVKNIKDILDLREFHESKYEEVDKLSSKLDSMKNVIKVRDYDSIVVPETQNLYIKRLWYNSDHTPFSYDAYGKVGFKSTHRHGLLTSSSTNELVLDVDSEYVGEYNVEYINIVLSDNTFYRFKADEHIEWLVAKEGDKVTKVYYKSNSEIDYSKLHQSLMSHDINLDI